MSLENCRIYRALEMVASTLLMLCFDIVLLLRSACLPIFIYSCSDDEISLRIIRAVRAELRTCNMCCCSRVCDDGYYHIGSHPHGDVRPYLRDDPGTKDTHPVRLRYVHITIYPLVVGVPQTAARRPTKGIHCLGNHPRWYAGIRVHFW